MARASRIGTRARAKDGDDDELRDAHARAIVRDGDEYASHRDVRGDAGTRYGSGEGARTARARERETRAIDDGTTMGDATQGYSMSRTLRSVRI